MFKGLLPIGSIVRLKNGEKKVMIMGVCQISGVPESEEKTMWDYSACLYPEGYSDPENVYVFNNDQIDMVFSLGFQDEEQIIFKTKADAVIEENRNEQIDEINEEETEDR